MIVDILWLANLHTTHFLTIHFHSSKLQALNETNLNIVIPQHVTNGEKSKYFKYDLLLIA